MSENKIFKQKAVFVKYVVDLVGAKQDKKISIVYTRPDTETPNTELKVGGFENTLDAATKTKLKELAAGDEVCVTKEQNGKFWNLVSVTDVSEAPVRTPKPEYGGGGGKPYGSTPGNKGGAAYSPGGQTIGMAIKAAVDFTIANHGNLGDVANTAREILRLSATLDSEYNAGLFKPAAKTAKPTATKEATPVVSEVDELANLDFN